MTAAPEDTADFHDPRMLQLAERLAAQSARTSKVERERDRLAEMVSRPTKGWFEACRVAEARVADLTKERDAVLDSLTKLAGLYNAATDGLLTIADGGYGDASVKARTVWETARRGSFE